MRKPYVFITLEGINNVRQEGINKVGTQEQTCLLHCSTRVLHFVCSYYYFMIGFIYILNYYFIYIIKNGITIFIIVRVFYQQNVSKYEDIKS